MAGASVLVVEDDAASRGLLHRRLQREGMLVEAVGDGARALALLAEQRFDIVLLDIGLPDMDGLEVLRRIRLEHDAQSLPVIMVTAFGEGDYLPTAFTALANDFVTKPVDFETLRARLAGQLRLAETYRQLHTLQQRQDLILRGVHDPVWEWDLQSHSLHHSPRWYELFGLTQAPEEETIAQWLARTHPQDAALVEQALEQALLPHGPDSLQIEYRILGGEQDYRWILTRGAVLRHPVTGQATRMAGTHTDLTELRYRHRQTGFPNGSWMHDHVRQQAERCGGNPHWGIVLFSLDNLHLLGQRATLSGSADLLSTAARQLAGALCENEQMGHGLSGHHLLAFSRVATLDASALDQMAQRGCEALRQVLYSENGVMQFEVSAGLATLGSVQGRAEELLAAAALAADQARVTTGIYAHNLDLRQAVESQQNMDAELIEAVHSQAIEAWWQPIVAFDSGALLGFEALARWKRGQHWIPPAQFIPMAQRLRLIPALTACMLQQSLEAIDDWRRREWVDGASSMSVNFPPDLFRDPELIEHLRQEMERYGLPNHVLQLEVTEDAALDLSAQVEANFAALRQAGFRIALDDFGTGYSSLGMLHQLAFDTLKIDQSFVRRMDTEPAAHALVLAIVAMGKSLQLGLVAEGVETETQADALRKLGVEGAQGYLFAYPMPRAVIDVWLQRRASARSSAVAQVSE